MQDKISTKYYIFCFIVWKSVILKESTFTFSVSINPRSMDPHSLLQWNSLIRVSITWLTKPIIVHSCVAGDFDTVDYSILHDTLFCWFFHCFSVCSSSTFQSPYKGHCFPGVYPSPFFYSVYLSSQYHFHSRYQILKISYTYLLMALQIYVSTIDSSLQLQNQPPFVNTIIWSFELFINISLQTLHMYLKGNHSKIISHIFPPSSWT